MELAVKFFLLLAILLYLLLKLTAYLLITYQNRIFAKSHNCLPPGRLPSSFVGLSNWVRLTRTAKRGDILDHILSHFPIHGNTWKGRVLFSTSIGTIGPENIKAILATSFKDFGLGSQRHNNFYPLLGDGIFTLDGAGDVEALELHVQRLMNRLLEGDGEVADLQPLFYCLTLDSATDFLLGESVDSLLSPELNPTGAASGGKEEMSFAQSFNRFRDANAIVHGLIDRYVDMALHPEKRAKKAPEGKYAFLDAIAAETRDPGYLRDQPRVMKEGETRMGRHRVLLLVHTPVFAD
ncbi:hypothetical protein B9Z19DRAFT_1119975 [Tuber borchii]|uniref:Cytochrome P450 n=1 Tax=Tuber borchii TaxID=42251 RepID=A0A2T7A552_TUBBO|nr:hypothetical protein B9Z19DRAFT_1119975 [Tuber borchii]